MKNKNEIGVMKIFPSIQIKDLDAYTIEHEPISSVDLMERAADAVAKTIINKWDNETRIVVFAGPGNNGGDALAVARILGMNKYKVIVYLFNPKNKLSSDCQSNMERLSFIAGCELIVVDRRFTPPALDAYTLVIDGLFGTGLNKPLEGGFAAVVKYINSSASTVVAIDVPSGLMCEDNTLNIPEHIIKADYTLTFQFPKLAFLFAENEQYVGEWEVLDIKLSQEGINNSDTIYSITEGKQIRNIILPRSRFSHKGTYGHGLLIAGSYGMAGAAVLAAKACMKSGIGLLTVHTPSKNNDIIQTSIPEVLVHNDENPYFFTNIEEIDNIYQAVAIGPGLGMEPQTITAVCAQLKATHTPMIIDADAINILANSHLAMNSIPENSILTPHPKEFQRLVGKCNNTYDMLVKACDTAFRYKINIILKGAWSAVITPEGYIHFNPTGNPGMATAGSGDVLTGILLGLLAQGYSPVQAAMMGTFLHGHAGDLAENKVGLRGMIASDIINYIPQAWNSLVDIS